MYIKTKKQKGVALIVTLLVTVIVLAIVAGAAVISSNKIKLIGDISKSVPAFYLAHTGVEKVQHYNSIIPSGATNGICNIAANCKTDANDPSGDYNTHCNNVVMSGADCAISSCKNCTVSFDSDDAGKKDKVQMTVSCTDFDINSTGIYGGVLRQVSLGNKNDDAPFLPVACVSIP